MEIMQFYTQDHMWFDPNEKAAVLRGLDQSIATYGFDKNGNRVPKISDASIAQAVQLLRGLRGSVELQDIVLDTEYNRAAIATALEECVESGVEILETTPADHNSGALTQAGVDAFFALALLEDPVFVNAY